MPWEKPEHLVKRWEAEYERDWKYFATSESVTFDGRTLTGLSLPQPVLPKLFHDNAVKWVPQIGN